LAIFFVEAAAILEEEHRDLQWWRRGGRAWGRCRATEWCPQNGRRGRGWRPKARCELGPVSERPENWKEIRKECKKQRRQARRDCTPFNFCECQQEGMSDLGAPGSVDLCGSTNEFCTSATQCDTLCRQICGIAETSPGVFEPQFVDGLAPMVD